MDFFTFFNIKTYTWVTQETVLSCFNTDLHPLISVTGSFTQEICKYSAGKITQKCVFFGKTPPHALERFYFSEEPVLWLRCMVWKVSAEVWVRTRSVFSNHSSLAVLQELGDQPLGTVLFADKETQRSSIQYAIGLYGECKRAYCLRLSVLYYKNKPIVVSEVLYTDSLLERREKCLLLY